MIKASFLQKQGAKYRELAREEVSLEMRRQLFALAARCDELAAAMARWPGPKDLAPAAAPAKAAAAKVAAAKPARSKAAVPSKPKAPAVDMAHDAPRGGSSAPAALPFAEGSRARLVHGLVD